MRISIHGNALPCMLFITLSALSPRLPVVAQESYTATSTEQLSAPVETVSYPDAFIVGQMVPVWSAGYLVAYRRDTEPSPENAPNLSVFDRKGQLVTKTRLWVEGASLLRIKGIAASSEGRLAIVGFAVDASGALAGFLADIVLTSHPQAKIVLTSPFEGQSVTFAPDGSLWLVGYQLGPSRSSEKGPDHFLVQHFGTDDIRKAEYLKRSSLACAHHPAAIRPQILTSDDRIGLFFPVCDLWIELKPDGELLGQWRLGTDSTTKAVGGSGHLSRLEAVALTRRNELYGHFNSSVASLSRFDRKTSRWVPVNTDATLNAGEPFGGLEGSEDDKLVYFNKASVVWARTSQTAK